MARTGSYTLWGKVVGARPEECLERLVRLARAQDIAFAARQSVIQLSGEIVAPDGVEMDEEILARGWPVDRVPELVIPDSCVAVHFGSSALAREIESEVRRLISDRTRGDLILCDPIVTVGRHLVLDGCGDDASEHPDGLWSFKLFGYGFTPRWHEYREAFSQLPTIAHLRHQVEKVCGQLTTAAFISQ